MKVLVYKMVIIFKIIIISKSFNANILQQFCLLQNNLSEFTPQEHKLNSKTGFKGFCYTKLNLSHNIYYSYKDLIVVVLTCYCIKIIDD